MFIEAQHASCWRCPPHAAGAAAGGGPDLGAPRAPYAMLLQGQRQHGPYHAAPGAAAPFCRRPRRAFAWPAAGPPASGAPRRPGPVNACRPGSRSDGKPGVPSTIAPDHTRSHQITRSLSPTDPCWTVAGRRAPPGGEGLFASWRIRPGAGAHTERRTGRRPHCPACAGQLCIRRKRSAPRRAAARPLRRRPETHIR